MGPKRGLPTWPRRCGGCAQRPTGCSPSRPMLRQLVIEYPGLPERPRGEIVAAIDRQAAAENGWTFVMLSPSQNKVVQRWLLKHSRRPQKATMLWAELFDHL